VNVNVSHPGHPRFPHALKEEDGLYPPCIYLTLEIDNAILLRSLGTSRSSLLAIPDTLGQRDNDERRSWAGSRKINSCFVSREKGVCFFIVLECESGC